MSKIIQHEYLLKEDYYEYNAIGTGARTSKRCDHCGKNIPKCETFKIKSKNFLLHEGKSLDKEVVDIEQEQST